MFTNSILTTESYASTLHGDRKQGSLCNRSCCRDDFTAAEASLQQLFCLRVAVLHMCDKLAKSWGSSCCMCAGDGQTGVTRRHVYVSKARVSHWKPHNVLFSLPNHTGWEFTSGHHVCSVERVFFFFAVTHPRCRITRLYLLAVSYFNHWGGGPLPAVTTAPGWTDQQNGTLRLLIGSHAFSFFINYEVSPGSSAGLPRLPEDPAGFRTVPRPHKLARPLKFSLCFQRWNISSTPHPPSSACEYDHFPP